MQRIGVGKGGGASGEKALPGCLKENYKDTLLSSLEIYGCTFMFSHHFYDCLLSSLDNVAFLKEKLYLQPFKTWQQSAQGRLK